MCSFVNNSKNPQLEVGTLFIHGAVQVTAFSITLSCEYFRIKAQTSVRRKNAWGLLFWNGSWKCWFKNKSKYKYNFEMVHTVCDNMFLGLSLSQDKLVCIITTYLCSFTATYLMIYKLGCFLLSFLPCFPSGSWILLITNHEATASNIIKNII